MGQPSPAASRVTDERARVPTVTADDITFSEAEVAQILWVLTEAAEHAANTSAFSALVLLEETLRMVRGRFDDRGET